jgi:hypothetical protein
MASEYHGPHNPARRSVVARRVIARLTYMVGEYDKTDMQQVLKQPIMRRLGHGLVENMNGMAMLVDHG